MQLTTTYVVSAMSRGSLLPDPRYDAVKCILLAVMDDDEDVPDGRFTARVLLCDDSEGPLRLGIPHTQVTPSSFTLAFRTQSS